MDRLDTLRPLITVLLDLLDRRNQTEPDSTLTEAGLLAVTQRVRHVLADALPPSTPTEALATTRLRRRLDLVIRAVSASNHAWIIVDAIDLPTFTLRAVWLGDGLATWIATVLIAAETGPGATLPEVEHALRRTFQAARRRIGALRRTLDRWQPPHDPLGAADSVLALVDHVGDPARQPILAAARLATFLRAEVAEVGAPWSQPWARTRVAIDAALATAAQQLDALADAFAEPASASSVCDLLPTRCRVKGSASAFEGGIDGGDPPTPPGWVHDRLSAGTAPGGTGAADDAPLPGLWRGQRLCRRRARPPWVRGRRRADWSHRIGGV